MSDRFKPLGRAARWRILYEELLVKAEIGDLITYEQMAEVLDLDSVRDRGKILSGLGRAEREFLEEHGHALKSVRDVGYEVADAADHILLAHRQQRRAGVALERGHSLATQIDLTDADPSVRNALHMIGNAFAFQMQVNKKLDVRQRQLEDALKSTQSKQDRTMDEVEALKDRLRRLEDQIDP